MSVRSASWLCFGLLGVGLSLGCQTDRETSQAVGIPPSALWFTDITESAGVRFVHRTGPIDGRYFFPQIVGSGAALFDFDGDGRLDIYLIQNAGPQSDATNRLYQQQADGTFRDVSAGSGLNVAGYGMGVAVGDINNDGRPDVLLTEYGRVRLFLNRDGRSFTDATKQAGLDNPFWGTSASFVDYDRDGWLDLVVANYVAYNAETACHDRAGRRDFCTPTGFPGSASRLYHNVSGRPGSHLKTARFEDVTRQSGLGLLKSSALGVVCADFTGDRWPDILVANDGARNHLWINHGNGTFTEEGIARGIAYNAMGQPEANMGIAVGDVNGDGMLDVFITHLTTELHVAWLQGPAGLFQDRTSAMGLAHPGWRSTGFGTVFGDFDQDGALDLALANGKVKRVDGAPAAPEAGDFWAAYAERNQIFANDGAGKFRDVSTGNAPFSEPAGVSRGLAIGDIDGDGALDLLVTRVAAPVRLFRNVAQARGHWLKIRAIDPALGGRDAYGSEVTVRAGNLVWRRYVNPGFSYLVSNAPEAHFGLGRVAQIDSISVVWPDGTEEQFPGSPVDRSLVLRKTK